MLIEMRQDLVILNPITLSCFLSRSKYLNIGHSDMNVNSQSYFSRVQDILDIYNLPSLQYLSENLTSKENWKFQVKRAVNKHWSELLQKEASEKSTLKYMNIESMKIGQTHVV